MFTRAGFSTDAIAICVAIVRRRGRAWWRPSYLHRWADSGELAWLGGGGISWGEQLVFGNFIQPPRCDRPREALAAVIVKENRP